MPPPGLRRADFLAIVLIGPMIAGCGRGAERSPHRAPVPIPLRILADSGRSTSLSIGAGLRAQAWIQRVSREAPAPATVAPAPPGALAPPVPEVVPDSLVLESAPPPALVVGEDLMPPIPRGTAVLRLPAEGKGQLVDLDVRVDEAGQVSDALWAAGSRDSNAVAAAVECALGMRFYPALQRGRPVAVWCRQRFQFGRGAAHPVSDGGDDGK
jgi:hypothetical protein